jgi:penicillin-binding protein 1B
VQGGSTLTQQLVKNLFLTPERTFRRKAVEALLAVILEVRYDKQAILESYLNEIYLGQRGSISVTGVEEASKYYFGKPSAALNIPESALLAGLIASPGRFSPFRSEENARNRRALVLKGMLEMEKISKGEYEAALEAPLTSISKPASGIQASHFVDLVLSQMGEPREKVSEEGYAIYTTLDPDMQTAAEAAVQKGIEQLESRFKRLRTKPGQEPLQAALIALDPATGAIRALVGGRDYSESQFNRVVQAKRQPGSLFKPFVFLAAFSDPEVKNEVTPASILQDSPISIEFGGGQQQQVWTPKNYDGAFRGPITARQALELSINIPTVRVALSPTSSGDNLLPSIVALSKASGISTPMKAYPSLALGSYEVTPMEMASSYAIFANGGYRVKPSALLAAVKPGEDSLLKRVPKSEPMSRAAEAAPVALVTEILRGAVDRGTGASARRLGASGTFAGKTGTTNDGRDAWFIGYSPRLLVAVWVGFDDNRGLGLSGSMAAVPIFAEFAKHRPAHEFNVGFIKPPGLVQELIDPSSGFLARDSCPTRLMESFLAGTEPTQSCPLHGGRAVPENEPDSGPGLLPPT